MAAWLLRHAETEWSVARRHTGRTDIPLTEHGRAVAAGLLLPQVAETWASPLARARETAALAGFERPVLYDALMEWDYGAYEGRTTAEIRAERPGWSLWDDGAPDGESAQDVGDRLEPLLGRLAARDHEVLVVAHGHVLRVLAARWLGLPPACGRLFAFDPAHLGHLGHEREQRVLRAWNVAPAQQPRSTAHR